VRRHGANMTAGKSKEELNLTALAAFKKALDRSRRAGLPAGGPTPEGRPGHGGLPDMDACPGASSATPTG